VQEVICKNEYETKIYASNLASILKKGDLIILTGELGAGKTKFVEGVLTHFGMQDEISSPTFTIVNEYHNNKADIYHFDLYRLSDVYEFENIDGESYFSKGICIFEWGEMIEDILPEDYLKITFAKDDNDENVRKLEIEPKGERFKDIDFTTFSKTLQ
jgi:tRNA threonylcarbamoyladenosine biosynthesis protein TsaE